MLPQLMPVGELVTVPEPVPTRDGQGLLDEGKTGRDRGGATQRHLARAGPAATSPAPSREGRPGGRGGREGGCRAFRERLRSMCCRS